MTGRKEGNPKEDITHRMANLLRYKINIPNDDKQCTITSVYKKGDRVFLVKHELFILKRNNISGSICITFSVSFTG